MLFYNYKLYPYIFFLSNTYCIDGTTIPETTETTQTTTYTPYVNTQNNRCIYNSYCFPIIITISIVLFAILVVHCWQYYVNVLLVNIHSKKNKNKIPIRYVVNEVHVYNEDETREGKENKNLYSEI